MAFPQIGLRAVLELTGFQKQATQYQRMMHDMDRTTKATAGTINRSGQNMARSFEGLSKQSRVFAEMFQQVKPDTFINFSEQVREAFEGLGRGAQVNVEMFDRLIDKGIELGQAMRIAGGQVQFNEQAFDQLVDKGIGVEEALTRVSSSAGILGQQVTILGRSFSLASIAATAFTVILTAMIKATRDAIEDYTELAEATRRVHYQTGMLADEASTWVLISEAMGVAASTSERALTAFLSKIGDLRREILLGEESTSAFAIAMRSLGVDILDQGNNLKSTQQLLTELNQAFRDYGAGVQTATWAQDLFGYSGRFFLPILVSQARSLADVQEYAERVGATIKIEDLPAYEDWLNATIDLNLAQQGLANTLASELLPILTDIKKAWAEVLGFIGRVIRDQENQERMEQALADAYAEGNVKLAQRLEVAIDVLYADERLARAEAELKQQRDAEAQAAAQAAEVERELQKEREKTLQQLDELKSKLSEKLLGIERETTERYNAIFVDRMRDAMERMLRLTWKMDDLRADLDEKLGQIEQDFAERWNQILVQRGRDAFEGQLRTFWRLIDMQRDYEQSRQDVMRDYADREADLREDTRKRIEELEEDSRERREDLERDHQKRLAKIQQDYQDTVEEAARVNDAVAVARAMRERAREQRDEQKRFTEDQRELEDSLKKKRDKLAEDRREREADQERELQRALGRLEENYQQQRDQMGIELARERTLREIHYRWEVEDFNAAKQKQLDDAWAWYDKQYTDMQEAQKREDILNEMHYQQQLDDLALARQAQRDEAARQYGLDRDELAEQLKMTRLQLEDEYASWILQAALAAGKVAAAIATTWTSEISRYQQYLPYPPSEEIERYRHYQPQPQRPPIVVAQPGLGGWGIPQGPMISMATGGIVSASQPTTVLMGDHGPETGFFMPGGGGSLSVNHNFGRLGVDFNGLPGGMNTQQVQAIVYETVTRLAEGVRIPRS